MSISFAREDPSTVPSLNARQHFREGEIILASAKSRDLPAEAVTATAAMAQAHFQAALAWTAMQQAGYLPEKAAV